MKKRLFLSTLFLLLHCGIVFGQDYAGTYTIDAAGGSFTLTLTQTGSDVQGGLTGDGQSLELTAYAGADGMRGTVTGPGEPLVFVARLCPEDDHLFLAFGVRESFVHADARDAIQLTFERERSQTPRPEATSSPSSNVVINGVRLSERKVRALEGQYGVSIPQGNYWYDQTCGAWGHVGGPTVGYILSGLAIGGRLRPDASNGNTGVFVNGRELHFQEVRDLRLLVGVVYPGRYWFDSQGNYGFEGGAAVGNLRAIAQRTGARREGILSTYDKTGLAVIGATR